MPQERRQLKQQVWPLIATCDLPYRGVSYNLGSIAGHNVPIEASNTMDNMIDSGWFNRKI
jgi:hypothetical protein